MYDYQTARKNAAKVADNIYGLHIRDELDDGTYWIFPWLEEGITEIPLCVHKNMGGICLYDPEAHPEFKNAVPVKH